LKSLLKAALPVWHRIEGAYDLKDFSVTTPVGSFDASHLAVGFGMDGVSQDGSVDYAITASGLKVPTALIPSWIVPLLPTDVDLHFGGAGIALDRIAEKAIDGLDLDRDPPIAPEVQDAIQAEFMAHLPKVVMQKSTISNGDTTVSMQGEMTFPRGRADKPDATVTIDVKGYDKITDALQEAAKTEPQASQVFTGALMAKGFGKAMPDGSLEWAVTVKADGSVSINGATLKGADAP
jgi:hypothetical protein